MKHTVKRSIIPLTLAAVCVGACALDSPAPVQQGGKAGSGGTNPVVTTGGSSGSSSTTGGVAGTTPTAGSAGTAPTAGSAGSPPQGGSGGSTGGTGGGTGGSTGGTGGTPNLNDVAAQLHGHTILSPCFADRSDRVCDVNPQDGCPNDNDPVLDGYRGHDEMLTMGGAPGTFYEITIQVQGQVEAKTHAGGMDQSFDIEDGWYVGGEPTHGTNAYNVYAMRVSSPQEDYFFNNIATSQQQTNIRHTTFDLAYTATFVVEGGAMLRMISADTNCDMIKNCADPDIATECNPHEYPSLDAQISDDVGSQPYNGQFVGILVTSVTETTPP